MFVPKLFSTLKGYSRDQFVADLTAGVIVGIVALPLAIAFGIASGVAPERGLWTAIIAGFLISVLGGSRVQIGGPTGAFVVIIYGVVQQHGLDGLAIATVMAGIMLVLLGIARLGTAIKFIPVPVITGFTSGIAVIIFSSQVKDFLGLRMGAVPPEFLEKWTAYAHAITTVSPASLAVATISLCLIVFWPRVSHRIPGPFVALVASTLLVHFGGLEVETIGSRFGAISASIPSVSMPQVTLATLKTLVGPAFTIALLGAVESLLSAVVADGMIGSRHRSNMELVGQGVANIVVPFFGGIPATGAIARTATNVKNGGRTPVAGITHALTLLAITLFFGPMAAHIPMATLAAILVVVAYHMSEWRTFLSGLRSPRSDVVVLLTTFLLTVLIDLTVAIEVGIVLAALLFMRRMAEVTSVSVLSDAGEGRLPQGEGTASLPETPMAAIPDGVQVYAINGPFFFGAAEKFKDTLSTVAGKPRVLIIRMRDVPAIDATGMHALLDVVRRSRRDQTAVWLSEVHTQPLVALTKAGAIAEIGEDHLFATLDDALAHARGAR